MANDKELTPEQKLEAKDKKIAELEASLTDATKSNEELQAQVESAKAPVELPTCTHTYGGDHEPTKKKYPGKLTLQFTIPQFILDGEKITSEKALEMPEVLNKLVERAPGTVVVK